MIIDIVSDVHGHQPKLDGGDLLIVAGDLTARNSPAEYFQFFNWMWDLKYKKKVIIAGNHDNLLFTNGNIVSNKAFDYLCDSGTEFEGIKIWGMPWSLKFIGLNPHCAAFTCTEKEIKEHVDKIPDDIDILISHGPAHSILDKSINGKLCGSFKLNQALIQRIKPKLFVSGHIHEAYGQMTLENEKSNTICVNASIMNERYEPVNKPIRVIL